MYYLEDLAAVCFLDETQMRTPQNRQEEILSNLREGTIQKPFVLAGQLSGYGAASMLLVDELFKDVPGDMYILPSSMYETMVFPSKLGYDPITLQARLEEINKAMPEMQLSNKIYRYNAKAQQLRIYVDHYGYVPECFDALVPKYVRHPHPRPS